MMGLDQELVAEAWIAGRYFNNDDVRPASYLIISL